MRHSRSPSLGSVRSGINNEAHKVKLLFATLRNLNVLTFYLSNSLMPAIYIINQFLQSSYFWCCHHQKLNAIFIILIKSFWQRYHGFLAIKFSLSWNIQNIFIISFLLIYSGKYYNIKLYFYNYFLKSRSSLIFNYQLISFNLNYFRAASA